MLTHEEFYISPEVRKEVENFPEAFAENMGLVNDPSALPLLTFAKESIEEYKNLLHMVRFAQGYEEFLVHSMYYIMKQSEMYQATANEELQRNITDELAMSDLLEIYGQYDNKLFIP